MNVPRYKSLVTGLNGIVGWYLFKDLGQHHDADGTFRKRHPSLTGERMHRIDLESEEQVARFAFTVQPDYFVHAWSMCDLDLCELCPELAHRINVEGTRRMLEVAGRLKVLKKFIYLSTDHVFGGQRGGYEEGDRPRPKHAYGKSKREAEYLVEHSGLPYLIIRPGLVIGQSFQGNIGPRDFLFSRIRAAKPTHLFTDEWRTPIDAEEFSRRAKALILSPKTGVYHIAGRQIYNRYELGRGLAAQNSLTTEHIYPRLRSEDRWAHIRPRDLSLRTVHEDT
ncbi:MAG: sugar nucleotide-binding protein [Candidatus Omnitrophota bacterium]|nr:sugar nucleotide-binding protein [Candidatus Omnitrophota bacterium]